MTSSFKKRLHGLQENMGELDLIIFGSCQNFQYLTGLNIDWRHGTDLGSAANNIFIPKEGEPILALDEGSFVVAGERYGSSFPKPDLISDTWIKDIRFYNKEDNYNKFLNNIITDLNIKCNKIGMGENIWSSNIIELFKLFKNAVYYNAESLMEDLRMIKDQEEMNRLKKVARISEKVLEKIIPEIRNGITENELEYKMEYYGKLLGATDVSFPIAAGFVKSGSNTTTKPLKGRNKLGLKDNSSISFDIGFVMDGYCSDFGRSLYFGSNNKDIKRGYEALNQSVLETVDKMYDKSMRLCDVFSHVEMVLDNHGYGKYIRSWLTNKNVGHNIGIEVHEPPNLSPNNEGYLNKNMVIAIEPKLWKSGEYYLRVEDMVRIGSNKSEFLTNFDREIFTL